MNQLVNLIEHRLHLVRIVAAVGTLAESCDAVAVAARASNGIGKVGRTSSSRASGVMAGMKTQAP
ncbi:MAG: hypothetical protein ABL878_20625, partial [Burkholderiales bacterium]